MGLLDDLNGKQALGTVYRYQAPKKQAKKPNFLQSLLPSAGGLAGGTGGAAAGAAIGTALLPGIGTAAGGLLGALLGGGAGGAAGKIAENKALGANAFHDVGKEAAVQGVLSAGPIRLARGAMTAGKAAMGGAGLIDALATGGARAAAPSALKTAVANKVDNVAGNVAQRGLKINDSTWLTSFANRTGEEAGSFARRFNVPHNGLEHTAENVLHPGFAAHAGAVHAVGDLSKNEVLASVRDQVAKELTSKVPASRQFAKDVVTQAQGVLKSFNGKIPAAELNDVKTEIAGRVNHAATDTASRNANEVLNRVSGGFRKAINKAADTRGVGVDPALAKLGYKSKSVGDLGEELSNLKTLLEKADVKSRVGSGSNPLSLPALITGSGIGGPGGIAAAGAVQAINSTVGKRGIAKGIDAVARRADASALKSGADAFGIKKVASRVLPVGLAGALTNQAQQVDQSSQNIQTDTNTTMSPTANNIPTDYSANADPSMQQPVDNSPFAPQNVEANVQQMVANGAKMKDITAFLNMAKTIQAMQPSSTTKPLAGTQAQQASNAQSGLESLRTIADTLARNPNEAKLAALPGGSFTNHLTGTGSYKAAINNVADVIGRLRSGGAIQHDEEQRFLALLPSTFDDPQTQQYKLNQVASLLQKFANPRATAQPDPASLAAALGQ